MPKRIVVVSDLHAGSMYGLMPHAFDTYDGVTKPQNAGQEYLWKCWEDFCWRTSQFDPDAVIVNGDCIEGPQRKSNGFEVSLPSQDDQVDAAIKSLEALRARTERAKWYFTMGTPYHVGEWGGAEEAIARALRGESYPSVGVGKYCREALWLDAEGVVLEVAHHIGGASGFYRLTALDREGQWSAMAAKDASKGVPKADLLIRSHVHFFGVGEHASKQMLTTPCWKLADRYSRKGSMHRFHPDIGGVFIEIDGEGKQRGEAPCRIRKELYSLPPVPVVKL